MLALYLLKLQQKSWQALRQHVSGRKEMRRRLKQREVRRKRLLAGAGVALPGFNAQQTKSTEGRTAMADVFHVM